MQNVSTPLYQILTASQRDLAPVDLFEFYPPGTTDLIPGNAERRFAATSLVWYGWEYEQQAISRGDVSRYMTEKFNSVNITLSNVDRTVSDWLSSITLEGYRVVIRMVSRSLSDDSVVLFVGRCEKPGDIENAQVTLTAKQDLGTIENEIPFSKFDLKCPLKFKGTECLAGQTLTEKTATYQQASTCNKSWSQCFEYGNHKAFQGFRYRAVIGSFKVNSRPSGMMAMFGSRRATKQWSSSDNIPIGQSVPMGLGRTQIDLTPILYADTGEYLYGHFIAGEGPVSEASPTQVFADVRNTTAGWATTFQTKYEHRGDYGYDPDQQTDSALLGDEYYSHRAYVEATIEGNNPDTGDPAPTLAAVVLWQPTPTLSGACFDNTDWSDNPVEHVRFLLTNERALNYPADWIDDEVAVETAKYCNEPLIDESGCEEFWYDQNNGTAGIDWKRYRSTGILDWQYYKWVLGEITSRPQTLGAEYNAYDPENPPVDPPASTFYRKRYTSNWHLKEPIKVSDFLFKHLLPSFRGYLVTGADGKLQIKTERPALTSLLRNATSAGATTVAVEDVTAWQRLAYNTIYCHIGSGMETSETRRVTGLAYSSAGNSITLSGVQNVTAYSATFVGGSSTQQATNYFTVTGAATAAIVVVDGITITGGSGSGNATIGSTAAELATRINAHPTLTRYIEATWSKAQPAVVTLRAKLGVLTLDTPLENAHDTDETVTHVAAVFSNRARGVLTKSNIIRDTFKWPLGGRQSSYNQFSIVYTDCVQDFQQTELRENDYDHQERTNKINKLEISGACVDNYHQADRLVQAARYKYRDGDFFCSFQTTGEALLLEEGDVICVEHDNIPDSHNHLFRIEELRITQDHRVNIVARLYMEDQYPDAAAVRTLGLNTGSVWIAKAPPAVDNLAISYTTSDSGRVQFDFGGFVGTQTARIEIKRPGESTWLPVAEVSPDGLGRGAAEIPSLKPNTEIRVVPVGPTGLTGTVSTITATSPLYVWPTSYPSVSGYVLSSTTAGVMSWVAQSGGGGGTPGGSDTQVQFNDGGAFGGDAGLTYLEASDALVLAGEIRFTETGGGSDYVGFKAPSAITTSRIYTLPAADGTSGQVLSTDGTGGLSWATPSAGVTDGDKGDITVSSGGSSWIIDNDVITNAKIKSDAAIAYSKLASMTAGSVLLGNASNVPTVTALTGDVTVNSSGVTAIGSGVIVDADINASAGIAISKLAASAITIAGTSTSLGGSISRDTITGLSTTGVVKRTGTNTLTAASIVNADIDAAAAIAASKLAAAGSSGQLQYNASGTFGAVANATSDGTNIILASPRITTGVFTSGGSNFIAFNSSSSPGAWLRIDNNLSPSNIVALRAFSSPSGASDAELHLQTSGSYGLVRVQGILEVTHAGPSAGLINLYERTTNGSNYVTLKAPEALAANYTLTLPLNDGDANQVLATDGSGVTSWTENKGRTTLTANRTYYVGFDLGTCTITNASPGVVALVSHGLAANDPVIFSTTGTLPAPLIAGAVYYVKTVLTADTFTVSLTAGGTVINTTSAGSGTHRARTGKDTNDGLTSSRTGALLTVNKAIELVGGIDLAAFAVTIQLARGRYLDSIRPANYVGVGPVTILGDTATPSNVTIEPYSLGLISTQATTNLIQKTAHGLVNGTPIQFEKYVATQTVINMRQTYYVINANANDFQISTTVGGSAVTGLITNTTDFYCGSYAMFGEGYLGRYVLKGVRVGSNNGLYGVRIINGSLDIEACDFAGSTGHFGHVFAQAAAYVNFVNSFSISGGGSAMVTASDTATISTRGCTVTITGTPTFSSYCTAFRCGVLMLDQTVANGSISGSSWNITMNAVLRYSQDATTGIPGTKTGSTGTGGQVQAATP